MSFLLSCYCYYYIYFIFWTISKWRKRRASKREKRTISASSFKFSFLFLALFYGCWYVKYMLNDFNINHQVEWSSEKNFSCFHDDVLGKFSLNTNKQSFSLLLLSIYICIKRKNENFVLDVRGSNKNVIIFYGLFLPTTLTLLLLNICMWCIQRNFLFIYLRSLEFKDLS